MRCFWKSRDGRRMSQRENWAKLYSEGLSIRKIAEQEGIDRPTISRALKSDGVVIQRTRLKFSIEKIRELAVANGGDCLETKFLGINTRHKFICNTCGHIWSAAPNALVHRGCFCSRCGSKRAGLKRRINIKEISKKIQTKGGTLLSSSPVEKSGRLKYHVKCNDCSFDWWIGVDKISTRWCPKCASKQRAASSSYNLEHFQKIAAARGGRCVSKKYLGIEQKLEFICSAGDKFEKIPALLTKSNPLHNSWCNYCSPNLNIAEELCRAVFEATFRTRFKSGYHFEWLRNVRGRKMQLDGYSSELDLAFEYQGQQHDIEIKRFGGDLKKRQQDDKKKLKLCQANGVRLIQVPFFPLNMQSLGDATMHVYSQLKREGVPYKPARDTMIQKLFAEFTSQPMRRLRDLAQERGGRCLSNTYLGMAKKYEWQCSKGHTWSALASSINLGTWCMKCHQTQSQRRFADNFKTYIERSGGKLLSPYVSNTAHVKVCCAGGHHMRALPADLKRNALWCLECR